MYMEEWGEWGVEGSYITSHYYFILFSNIIKIILTHFYLKNKIQKY